MFKLLNIIVSFGFVGNCNLSQGGKEMLNFYGLYCPRDRNVHMILAIQFDNSKLVITDCELNWARTICCAIQQTFLTAFSNFSLEFG